MQKKIMFLLSAQLLILTAVFAQNIAINDNGVQPDTSAMLDISSTTKGFLIPRMKKVEKLSIPLPAEGLMVYQIGPDSIGFHYYDGAKWIWILNSMSTDTLYWSTKGNSQTNPASNFIGTTDNQPLLFKIKNTSAGYLNTSGNVFWGLNSGNVAATSFSNVAIGNAALTQSTDRSNLVAIGDSALYNNGVGATIPSHAVENTAVGSKSLYTNTTGHFNTAIGWHSMLSNISGSDNAAVGDEALAGNSTGATNTATGSASLYANTTGNSNTATGVQSLFHNISGNNNTSVGIYSLWSNRYGYSNVAMGVQTLTSNYDRSNLVAIGDSALYFNGLNVTQSFHATGNTAVGSKTLYNNTTGYQNTGNGYQSLFSNNSGFQNSAIGYQSLYSNNSGNHNSANGFQSLFFNTGNDNTANGYQSLVSNTSGNNNTASGIYSLWSNTTGYSNVAMGIQTLANNTFQSNNVAIGDSAMYFNGYAVVSSAEAIFNTAVGSKSIYLNKSGSGNTATGYQAMYSSVTGNNNTANGYQALVSNTSGNNNVAFGYLALRSNIAGKSNTGIGSGADVSSSAISNATAIGANSIVDNANSMAFGDANVTAWSFGRSRVLGGNALQVGFDATNGNGASLTTGGVWTNASDSTKKEAITKLDGAAILMKLKNLSVTRWRYRGTSEYHIGPMAQDFYQLFNVGTDNKTISSIDPAGVALRAIQEQQAEIESLKEELKKLKAEQAIKLESLETRMKVLEAK